MYDTRNEKSLIFIKSLIWDSSGGWLLSSQWLLSIQSDKANTLALIFRFDSLRRNMTPATIHTSNCSKINHCALLRRKTRETCFHAGAAGCLPSSCGRPCGAAGCLCSWPSSLLACCRANTPKQLLLKERCMHYRLRAPAKFWTFQCERALEVGSLATSTSLSRAGSDGW